MSTAVDQGWVPNPSNDFGARLALVRHDAGWTNIRMAATICGLDANSWRAWEQTGRKPRNLVEVCEIIAEKSGCSMVWLMTGRTSLDNVRPVSTAELPVLLPRQDSILQPSGYRSAA